MNLVLLGAPGSGKGTQAKILSEYYGIENISLGDILRQEASHNTALGKSVKKYMNEGVLVPDEIIKEVIASKIDKTGFILDGFPRNINQATILQKILEESGSSLDKVIYLEVNQDTAVRRLSGRRVCKNCGALYHVVTMAPKQTNICDRCASELVVREDDKETTVRKRWEVFMNETHSLIDYYRKQDKLLDIDGNQDKDEVFERIKETFNTHKYNNKVV
ncbi:MAG: adenylate kinase [Candidatus Omnitrophica bacterium]|nr:adenylate kinase [Candidatus Omnitrophota bacterium]